VYESFYNSGVLQQLLEKGKEYVFISNIDNLGATVDISILCYKLPRSGLCEGPMHAPGEDV